MSYMFIVLYFKVKVYFYYLYFINYNFIIIGRYIKVKIKNI